MPDGRTGGSARAFELLEPLVKAATVRVHAPADGYGTPGTGPTWGSGFFIAPGWVLTCAHVIGEGGAAVRLAGREVGITFSVAGSPAAAGATGTVAGRVECVLPERLEERRPAPRALWDLPDLALVRVLAPISHACVWLTDRPGPRLDEAAYFGVTEDLGVREITGRTTRLRGTAANGAAIRLGDDDEIEPGMSGGPLVDLARGEVIGIVKARRQAGGGGIAVSVAQLRTLPTGATGQVGLYRRVMQGHDLYHYDQHVSDLDSRRTWTDVHDELPSDDDDTTGGPERPTRLSRLTRLTPGERTTLCGLLAELPPPGSSEAVRALAEAARGEEPDTGLPAPLTWRDGLGLLHDPPGTGGEAAAMLRYATDVSVADHREPPAPGADEELWDWVRATAARLWRPLRRELGERHERGLAERERRRRASAGQMVHGPFRPAVGVPPPGPSVLLEAWAQVWEDVYDWRVSVLAGPDRPGRRPRWHPEPGSPWRPCPRRCGRRSPKGSGGATPTRRPRCWRWWWRRICSGCRWTSGRCRAGSRSECSGRSCCAPGRRTVPGGRRAVGTGTGGPAAGPAGRLLAGPQVAPAARMAGRAGGPHGAGAVPGPGGGPDARDAARRAGRRVRGGGVPQAPADPRASCEPFHRGLREELADAGRAVVLPARLQTLRGRAYGADPDAYWAVGTALVWQDPQRPLPEDEPLQGDL
ncbi:trypsin-like peptidase domain-containing protein [Streptomyces cirratus]|uniref:trypsin-like peptidase domain-containing protein n=1 Tax=Streptomyces cirratus TaxID=68187 RepID=UPI00360C55DA